MCGYSVDGEVSKRTRSTGCKNAPRVKGEMVNDAAWAELKLLLLTPIWSESRLNNSGREPDKLMAQHNS
jgi:hypothetical protein